MAQDILATSPEIDLRKRWALMQLQNASSGTPTTGIGALARALQGAIGGYAGYQADQEDKAAGASLFGPGGLPGVGAAPSAPPSPPTPPAPAMPQEGQPMAGNLPRGIRNNNPGNIEDGPFARKMPGYAGSDGRFAKFAAPENGNTAIDSLLASYGARGINTVGGVINRWAPPSDNNPTSAYAATVAKGLGVDPSAPIDLSDPATRQKLGALIGQFENGRPVPSMQQPFQVAALGNGMPAAPQIPPAGPQVAQAPQPGFNPPAPNRASVQIPPDVQATIQRLGADPRTRPQAMQLYMQYAKPTDQWQQYKAPDGTMLQRNATTGEVKAAGTENQAISETQYAQQNWKQLGFPDPASTDPKSKNFWKEYNAKRLGGAGVNVAIDQSAPNEFEKHYGEGMGKRALDVINQGDAATQELQQSAMSRAFLSKVKTGALAPAQATAGAWAKAIGIDPATLGIDPNLPAISQAAQSAVAQQTIAMIGAGGFPANNFSNADRKYLQGIPANISNLPEANEILADIREKVAQRKIDRANAWADAREQGQSYEKFERDWRKQINDPKNDIFADVRAKVESMKGGAFQEIDGVQIRRKQ
jgi:hypothetical protein